MKYRISKLDDLEAITELVHAKNNVEAHHIPYCYKNSEHISKEFKDMLNGEQNLVVTAWNDEKLCGVLGFYCIDEINRVDCIGPFVECSNVNGQENVKTIFINVAKEMIGFARNKYPTYNLSFNINSKNVDCMELMKVLGSEVKDIELELCLKRHNFINKYERSLVIPFSLVYEEQLRTLHEETAPDFYLTSNELIKTIGSGREVYILIEENVLLGYGVLKYSTNTDKEICIEIIGVDNNYKGKGYGRMILNHLLCKAFERKSMEEVKLTVDDINIIALNLYKSFGFVCIQESCSFLL